MENMKPWRPSEVLDARFNPATGYVELRWCPEYHKVWRSGTSNEGVHALSEGELAWGAHGRSNVPQEGRELCLI